MAKEKRPVRDLHIPVTGLPADPGETGIEMARDGLRYGDPSKPRYATGRVDGRAPNFFWPGENGDHVGRQGKR